MSMSRKMIALCAVVFVLLCLSACGVKTDAYVTETTEAANESHGNEYPDTWVKIGNLPTNSVANVACDMLACYVDTEAIKDVQSKSTKMSEKSMDEITLLEELLSESNRYSTQKFKQKPIVEILEYLRNKKPVAIFYQEKWYILVGEEAGGTSEWQINYLADNGYHKVAMSEFDGVLFDGLVLSQEFSMERYNLMAGNTPTITAADVAVNMLAVTGQLQEMDEIREILADATTLEEVRKALWTVDCEKWASKVETYSCVDEAAQNLKCPIAVQNCATGEFYVYFDMYIVDKNLYFELLTADGYQTVDGFKMLDIAPEGVKAFDLYAHIDLNQ